MDQVNLMVEIICRIEEEKFSMEEIKYFIESMFFLVFRDMSEEDRKKIYESLLWERIEKKEPPLIPPKPEKDHIRENKIISLVIYFFGVGKTKRMRALKCGFTLIDLYFFDDKYFIKNGRLTPEFIETIEKNIKWVSDNTHPGWGSSPKVRIL